MGYSRGEIEESLSQAKYDDIFATYLLLGRKNNDVSIHAWHKWLSVMYANQVVMITFSLVLYSLKVMVLGLGAHYP